MQINISRRNNDYSLSGQTKKSSGMEILFTENTTAQAINTCRQRMPFAILGFIAFYLLIVVQIFRACLVDGIIIYIKEIKNLLKRMNSLIWDLKI